MKIKILKIIGASPSDANDWKDQIQIETPWEEVDDEVYETLEEALRQGYVSGLSEYVMITYSNKEEPEKVLCANDLLLKAKTWIDQVKAREKAYEAKEAKRKASAEETKKKRELKKLEALKKKYENDNKVS